jgi:hypothetical protein
VELSIRPFFKTGIALTMAGAIALSPVIAANQHPLGVPVHLPQVSVSELHLAAAISPRDVAALTANLNAALESAGSTVTALVDNASQTLTGALSTASSLNTSLWDQLIAASSSSPTLKAVLVALKAASGGALVQLNDTVGAVGDGITLTTGQVAELLTSAITGTVGTVAQAVARVVNNPLAVSSYIGLLNTPFGAAGLALQNGITGLSQLGTTGLHLANDLVHGVTAQVTNALETVNRLLDAGKTVADIALINGTLTAIQGIVTAPVSAIVAGVNGIASAVTNAGVSTLDLVAGGANAIVGTWLGSGSTPGAVIKAVSAIGQEPLSLGSYTRAVSILVGAAGSTVGSVASTVTGFASMPFHFAADLTGPGAQAVNSLVSGVATAASGLLRAAGLSPLIAGLPNNLATVVTSAVTAAALATKTTLNAIATAIDVGHAIGGWVTSSKTATAVTLSTAKVSAEGSAIAKDAADASSNTGHTADSTKAAQAESAATSTSSPEAPAANAATSKDDKGVKGEDLTHEAKGANLTVDSASQVEAATGTDDKSVTTPSAVETRTAPKASVGASGEGTDTATTSDVGGTPKVTKEPDRAQGAVSSVSPSASSDNHGRHAASTDRKAGVPSATNSTTTAGTSSSDTGGRHRRADGTARKAATDNNSGAATGGTSTGGRHAASTGKHAAAA